MLKGFKGARNGFNKFSVGSIVLVLSLTVGACSGSIRHIAVQMDESFAKTVFALDDARDSYCRPQEETVICKDLKVKINVALVDVVAVTQAIKETKGDVPTLPKSIPALIKDLTDIQRIIAPLSTVKGAENLVSKSNTALNNAIGLLDGFAKGTN